MWAPPAAAPLAFNAAAAGAWDRPGTALVPQRPDPPPAAATGLTAYVAAELAQRKLGAFCRLTDPLYEPARHSYLLAEHLEALERRDIDRLIVEMPPRHSKTYHTSQRFVAWYLGRNPRHQIVLASYGAELAQGNSRIVRALLGHPQYPFTVRVSPESRAVNRWHTTGGGQVIATGVGGAMTGFGAHLLNIDDPVKGAKEADSSVTRAAQWNWYTTVANTRRMPKAVQLITLTRWHEDDIVGRILNSPAGREWVVLRLPAIAEDPGADPHGLAEPDPLGRRPGEALWPAWFPIESFPRADKGEISDRWWLALYQQRPTSPAGAVFHRAWFGHRYRQAPPLQQVIQVVDSAWKTGVHNDWSVIATWGRTATEYYLLDIWRERVEMPELIQAIRDQYAVWRPNKGVWVDKASGIGAIQTLRRESRIPVQPYDPRGLKKVTRAESAATLCQAGLVWLPEDAPWTADWVEEHVAFPGTFDDQVDTTSMGLDILAPSRGRSGRLTTG